MKDPLGTPIQEVTEVTFLYVVSIKVIGFPIEENLINFANKINHNRSPLVPTAICRTLMEKILNSVVEEHQSVLCRCNEGMDTGPLLFIYSYSTGCCMSRRKAMITD